MATLSTQQVQFEQALANLLEQFGIDLGDISGGGSGTISDARLAIIQLAMIKLDEVHPYGEQISFSIGTETNISDPLQIMINALLDEAAKRVLMNCPLHYLDPVKSTETAGTANTGDTKTGYIPLAANFLRFVSLKMADWKRAVAGNEIINQNSPNYSAQFNPYSKGGTAKPVAAFSFRTISTVHTRVIEYYSINTSHNIDYLYYIQETVAENVQSNLIDALTWAVAGMVLQVTERVDLANEAFKRELESYNKLNIITNNL